MRFISAAAMLLAFGGAAQSHIRTDPEGFSINLPVKYERLADIMREVCTDGVIHGTFEYQKETIISGASDAKESTAFPEWTGKGAACFKFRTGTLAPANFVATNDVGTLTIRYIVEPVDAEHTHISIDAVFIEDFRQKRHPSKGLVETAEFRQIAKELKDITDAENRKQQEADRRERQKVRDAQDAKERELKGTLAALNKELQDATAQVQELQQRAAVLGRTSYVRIKAPAAELKTEPLALAGTIQRVESGQRVTVLQRTLYWDRVRTTDGREGWIYAPFVEALP